MATIYTRKGEEILVDDEDYDRLSQHSWHLDSDGYAVRSARHPIKPKTKTLIRMHREVMGLKLGDPRQVDHKDHIKTDNRKSELRICDSQKNRFNTGPNSRNKSGYKGVIWLADRRKFRARICRDGNIILLGYFDSAQEAHAAYCRAAIELHGEFSRTA